MESIMNVTPVNLCMEIITPNAPIKKAPTNICIQNAQLQTVSFFKGDGSPLNCDLDNSSQSQPPLARKLYLSSNTEERDTSNELVSEKIINCSSSSANSFKSSIENTATNNIPEDNPQKYEENCSANIQLIYNISTDSNSLTENLLPVAPPTPPRPPVVKAISPESSLYGSGPRESQEIPEVTNCNSRASEEPLEERLLHEEIEESLSNQSSSNTNDFSGFDENTQNSANDVLDISLSSTDFNDTNASSKDKLPIDTEGIKILRAKANAKGYRQYVDFFANDINFKSVVDTGANCIMIPRNQFDKFGIPFQPKELKKTSPRQWRRFRYGPHGGTHRLQTW